MSDKCEEYLVHAEHCRSMSEDAKAEEVKAGWLLLAEKWMAMAAQYNEPQSAELVTMLERVGIRRSR